MKGHYRPPLGGSTRDEEPPGDKLTETEFKDRIAKRLDDPASAHLNRDHPDHAAAVAEVTQLYRQHHDTPVAVGELIARL